MAVALAGQLREGTKKSHTMAENTGFVACFLKGVVEKKFKEDYSNTLNQLPINQNIADQIIDEANQAFTYNMKMFKELEGNLIAVLGKIVFNYLTKKVRQGSTET